MIISRLSYGEFASLFTGFRISGPAAHHATHQPKASPNVTNQFSLIPEKLLYLIFVQEDLLIWV